ncbi:PilX N-terminal domain-containing pilus assembly protein [Pseudobacteroides cellulosolvens]|uniref:Type 4 fimbrial biogenesis protein PilX, N-terminal domain containing protein n=1 Tax=Pseudobacteroides cellulosolvens ATCC 35603 = DSM 2933 TaxID=398512 RepID=A0A0L6JLS2_9FIRM|nr:PilX N-terminal domain-containing pilus assembly protein [Pseudobacteroides cellulosolvens]KNY26703.1 Type 4 fimbrial biogenesis protein PilX, N-terminal domain containing protein [Pseudobacteroides cellulosolvens ATCC 35603 = DSM 2933]
MDFKLRFFIKESKNKGSALVLVLLMLVVMSLLGVSLVMLTTSGLQMSVFHSDLNKAFYTAESAVEQVASVLNEKVALLQEQARAVASSHLQELMEKEPERFRSIDGNIIKSVTENEFRVKYLEAFYDGLNTEFGSIDSEYKKTLLGSGVTDSLGNVYKDLGLDQGTMYLESAEYNNISYNLKVITKGVFNDYKKRLEVTFELLPDSTSIPYQGIGKVSVNKVREIPGIFDKELVAEKNIFAVSGEIMVKGDVLCFGTVPVDSGGEEDQTADINRYGGIIAGMSTDVTQYSNEFGFDLAKTGSVSKGKIQINGNAATMGYIHSIYGDGVTQSSDITINGETYARSIRLDEKSNYSKINLNGNVYVTDNLQIDSNESEVNVSGEYYGFVDAAYMINGKEGASLEDNSKYKRSSSITVNGDSILNIKNKLFLGGSTFIKNADGDPFMTGISALKSGRRFMNAFMENDEETGEPNPLYWYESKTYTTETPYFSLYNVGGTPVQLMAGRNKNGVLTPFPSITTRGMHFKRLWDNLWNNPDDIRSSYLDTENISIMESGIDGNRIIGYSNGAIVANGHVYGVDDFSGNYDSTMFHNIQVGCIEKYHDAIKDFLTGELSGTAPKLDYARPTKTLDTYKGDVSKYTGPNKIVVNEPYIIKDTYDNDIGMFYYGIGDTEITPNGSNCIIGGKETIPEGIIYVEGNIYIKSDFKFDGVILATGNIIFLGNSEINENKPLIDDLFRNDINLKGFFNLLEYEIPNETIRSQRVDKRNISVSEWKEVKP